jgi:hypothetical protein
MIHHLYYETFDEEADDVRPRRWRNTLTRQPAPRRGGARRAVGRALMQIGERIADERSPGDLASNNQAAGK